MPNWTENVVTVTAGSTEEINSFLDKIRGEEKVIDFNCIIQMPEILRHTGSGFTTIDGERVSSWYIEDGDRSSSEFTHGKTRLFTESEKSELKTIGHSNWYSWCFENWGTKWNACHTEDVKVLNDRQIEIRFDTAWTPPEPIIVKMREMFPNLEIKWLARDEDRDNDDFYEC